MRNSLIFMVKFSLKTHKMGLFYTYFTTLKPIVRKPEFCETLSFIFHDLFVYLKYSFPNFYFFGILLVWIFTDFHKTRGYLMPESDILFDPINLDSTVRYKRLFDCLPRLEEPVYKTGRKPLSRSSLLKAMIYKSLRRLSTLSDLSFELNNNPTISKTLGFNPLMNAPSIERFSSFLRDSSNQEFQTIHQKLVKSLITSKVITGETVAIDSCPIVVALKENNLKTSVKDRFDKTKAPAGDPEARLGVMIHYPTPFKKKVQYFWGYKNHVVTDTMTELPLWERTKPANIHETRMAKSLIRETRDTFQLKMAAVIGDAAYDSESFLTFIVNDIKAQPIIPRNPRNTHPKGYQIKGNKVICEAGLSMYRKGKMRPKQTGILYCQYCCPIHYDTEVSYQYIVCPIFHPKFFKGKGCNALIRLEPSIREKIDYGTINFKELYNSRTSVERVFSRLLSIAMQNPTVRGLQAVSNHVTIAHICVLLIALMAQRSGQKDKIRFMKSFVPNFLD